MEPKYKVGDVIEYQGQRMPDRWIKAKIKSISQIGNSMGYIVEAIESKVVTRQSEIYIRRIQ